MINNVSLVGRLTKEVEVKKTQSGKSVATFTLAINDPFQKDHSDFISCVAWNQSAEYLGRYAKKGDVAGVEGRITTRSYEGQVGKVYVTEVTASRVTLFNSKKEAKEESGNSNIEINPDELPFY